MSNKPKTRRKTAQKNSAKPRSTTQRRGDGWKWFLIVLAIAVLAVAITAGITNGFKDWNPYGWFDKKIEQPGDDQKEPGDETQEPCVHEYADGVHVCLKCGQVTAHEYAEGSHACTVCGEVSAHEYAEGSHECTVCHEVSEHAYAEGSHECTVCGEVSAHAYDADGHVCTVCGECKEHRYNDKGACMYCGGRQLRYSFNDLTMSEATEFRALTAEIFPTHAEPGAVVEYVSEPISVTLSEGLKINYTVTNVTASVYISETGVTETIDMTQTETGWRFTVPELNGVIEVHISGTAEKELPEGYHTVAYDVRDNTGGVSVNGGWTVAFNSPSYAKEGDIVKVELVWNMWGEGGKSIQPINNITVSYSSENVSESYAIKGDMGNSAVVFFTVGKGDVKLIIEIS